VLNKELASLAQRGPLLSLAEQPSLSLEYRTFGSHALG
jgi:hypothetical protein